MTEADDTVDEIDRLSVELFIFELRMPNRRLLDAVGGLFEGGSFDEVAEDAEGVSRMGVRGGELPIEPTLSLLILEGPFPSKSLSDKFEVVIVLLEVE